MAGRFLLDFVFVLYTFVFGTIITFSLNRRFNNLAKISMTPFKIKMIKHLKFNQHIKSSSVDHENGQNSLITTKYVKN